MPSKSNVDMLEKVSGSIDASNGVFVVDYRGLSVKETQEVRRALRAAGAEMKVYKNNIVKIALENAGLPNIDDMLAGTCAYVFYGEDPVEPAKVIKEQSEKLKKLNFIGAIADGKALTADEAKAYADLPNREQLMAQIAGRPTPTCPTASSSWLRSLVLSAASRATSPSASARSRAALPAASTPWPSRSRPPSTTRGTRRTVNANPRTPRGTERIETWLSSPPRRLLTPSRR